MEQAHSGICGIGLFSFAATEVRARVTGHDTKAHIENWDIMVSCLRRPYALTIGMVRVS